MSDSNRQRPGAYLKWVASVAERLGRPAPSLADPEAQRRSRLLLSLLIALIVSGALILSFQTLTNPGSFDDFDFWLTVLIWLSGFGLYAWARRGHTDAVASVLIAELFVLFTVAPFAPDSLGSLPFYVVIPLLLAALFFPLRRVIQLAALVLIVQIGLLALVPPVNSNDCQLMIESILFILPVGSMILVHIQHQNAVERIHQAELRAAYDRVRESEAALEQRVEERARELSRSERSLREAQHRYHALFEQAHDAVFILDLTGNHIEANRRAADMLGYTIEEIQHLSFRDLSAEVSESENTRERLLAGECVPVYERIFRKKDGTLVPVEINVELVRDMDGTPLHMQSVARDITERRQMENTLREQHAELDYFFSTALDLFCIADAGGHFVKVNSEWEVVLGYSAAELQGRRFLDFVHPDDLQPTLDAMAALDAQRPILNFINRYRTKDGRYRFIEWHAHPHGELIYAAARDITERMQMELALRESETNFRNLFNTVQDFLYVLDGQGNILEVNQTVLERLGYAPEELMNQPVLVVHPEARRAEAAFIVAEMLQGRRDYCPVPVQTKAGDLIAVETYITPGTWNGQPALFGVSKDISALKMSEEKFATAFHANPAIAGLSDIESGEYIEVNQTFCDKLGFSPEEVIGKKAVDVLRLDSRFRETLVGKLRQQGFVRSEEAIIYTKDGTPVPVLLSAEILRLHNTVYNYTIAVDISERKQMENTLRESEARHRALLDAIPDLVFRTSRDGTHLDYHAKRPEDLFVPPEQFVGRKINEVMPPDSAERHMRAIEQALQTGQEQTYEYALSIGGQVLDFEARMVAAGPDEVLTIVRNITERKQMRQREFDLVLERERVRLLRHFIEKASHEFRTPLSVINAAAFLMQRVTDPESRADKAQQIEDQVHLMTRLVDGLLLMAKLESSSTLACLPVNMDMIFDSLCQTSTTRYGGGPAIRCEGFTGLPPVMGDPDYLMEALRQILDNAYRFSPLDSTITVAAGAENSHLWITVRDGGPGIPEDHLPHIFDLFWRYDEAHTTPGFGLGLSIARKIIELHGGRIDVNSQIGAGSTFSIILPVDRRRTTP